jgi:hypothetical protein
VEEKQVMNLLLLNKIQDPLLLERKMGQRKKEKLRNKAQINQKEEETEQL